jgi:hypothetical protein
MLSKMMIEVMQVKILQAVLTGDVNNLNAEVFDSYKTRKRYCPKKIFYPTGTEVRDTNYFFLFELLESLFTIFLLAAARLESSLSEPKNADFAFLMSSSVMISFSLDKCS